MSLRLSPESPAWRAFCTAPDRLDAKLRDALDSGAPVFLTSRFSSPTGTNARSSAINSLYEAAQVLIRQTGIDVVDALPSREDLEVRLRNAPGTRSKRLRDGQDIQHRFVKLDLRPRVPVVLLIATGTGRIAAEGFVQPFTLKAAELVWETGAAIVATKRWDRTTRNEDLVGPLLMAMEENAAWVCTADLFAEMDQKTRLFLKMKSWSAGENTGEEDRAKRLGQADRTGRRMVDGQVRYHLPSAPAPGLAVATMKRRPNLDLERIAYLDTAACRPNPERVADGMSEVHDEDGEVVDQVANIQFFLAHFGVPEWMDGDRLHTAMTKRRFSTVHMRALYGPDAYATSTRGHTAWQAILDNLEMYETGVMRRSPGGDVPVVEIAGVMPPDGPWATADDFDRIRAWIAKGKARAGKQVSLGLSGLRANYDDVPCRTRSVAAPTSAHTHEPCLAFHRTRADGSEVRVDAHVLLPHLALGESIADAIVNAGSMALQPLVEVLDEVAASEHSEAALAVAEFDREIEDRVARRDGLLAQLGEVDDDGMPILRGRFLAAAQAQYEELEDQLLELKFEQREAMSMLETDNVAPADDGLDLGLLLHLLRSLGDPTDRTYARIWRRVITDLNFTTEPGPHPGKTSRRLHWSGYIRLSAGHATVVIPFEGFYDYRRVKPGQRRYVERQAQSLEQMLVGVPYRQIDLPGRHANRPRVAALLGVDPGHPVFDCEDPRILRVATALLRQRQGDAEVVAPEADSGMMDAIRRVHVDDPSARPWVRGVPPMMAVMYDLASGDGTLTVGNVVDRCQTTPGTVHTTFSTLRRRDPNWTSRRKKGYLLTACPRCGGHDRRPATIDEITGLLCRDCERDEAGVRWPLADYGPYLAMGGEGV